MAFKMRCPKCLGLDYSIERDNRTFGAVAQAFELVFHCRCGKQMFGEQLVKEYDRQKAEYDAQGHDDDADVAVARPAVEQPVTWLRPVEEPAVASPAEEARRREEEDRRWREKARTEGQDVAVAPARAPAAGDQVCAWPGCEKTRRPNSKYCSRACSNKNARARHKSRQKKAKKSAKSTAP